MTDPTPILAAIKACIAASPVPPTSGDLAAAVIRAVADHVVPVDRRSRRQCSIRAEMLKLATRLEGADD
jgi:hypothetical protein